jgi:restriction endonuclease S subunit
LNKCAVLKSNTYQNWVLAKRIGTAQPNINAQMFSSFEIPLPPLSEQQKIVSEIGKIEAQIAENMTVTRYVNTRVGEEVKRGTLLFLNFKLTHN